MSGISNEHFRDALRHWPAGVSIVTSQYGGRRHGMTASAVVSVSASPPLIAVVIDQAHSINPLLEPDDACFAVSMLAHDQHELANRFAFVKDEDRFLVGRWRVATTGAPVLEDGLAWLDCTIHSRMVAGSHTIIVGLVHENAVPRPDEAPLLYWNRDYRRLDGNGVGD